MVVWIILAINRSYVFMNNTRLQVRATNFAREWVEMMFNLRDTNRRKYSWKKDEIWDCVTFRDNGTCENHMTWGAYLLVEESSENDTYIKLNRLNLSVGNIDELYSDEWFWNSTYDSIRNDAKITFTWSYPYLSQSYDDSWDRTWHIVVWDIQELLWGEADFYRLVRIYGVYDKNTTSASIPATNTSNWSPVELRFCVKVFYRTNAPHTSELCSIMTNFEE